MSRCFYRELEANNITFLPEGLFDNLINLWLLWVNTSLFSLSNKLKRLSPKEPRDQPEVIRRTQGLKTSNSEEKFIYCCQILLCVLLKAVIFSGTQEVRGVICVIKPRGLVWKIKHDHSDPSSSSLTSVRISSYIDVKFGFLFYLKHSFLRESYKSFEKKL